MFRLKALLEHGHTQMTGTHKKWNISLESYILSWLKKNARENIAYGVCKKTKQKQKRILIEH